MLSKKLLDKLLDIYKLYKLFEYKENYPNYVTAASDYLTRELDLKNTNERPLFAIVLGSGLSDLSSCIENRKIIPYQNIPYFPQTTVPGHDGKLVIGNLEDVSVIGLLGRKHYYEVADMPFNSGMLQVIFPVHVLANLGIPNYFVTNAAGGLNPKYNVGDIMIIESHINYIPNPLLGKYYNFSRIDNNQTYLFQPMNNAYDKKLSSLLFEAGSSYSNKNNANIHHTHIGKYLALTGPSYETEAECIAFRDGLMADAVGMSTAPEVIVARNRGMNVVGMSCITNIIAEDGTNATTHDEVKRILESKETEDRLSNTIKNFFKLFKARMNKQS